MPEQPLDARQIFLEAVEQHAPPTWAAFLDAACGGDTALRQRVEELLEAHSKPNPLLDGAGLAATLDTSPSHVPGTQIGPYKLLQLIGEGGFGIVYMAEQAEPVKRRVALKLIKPGMDTRQVIARFEVERQALAVMDHPHIAKVLDAGATKSGRPYFVMELVRGIPITQYCDENSLPIRERLALFTTVCQAIQHAHTKGIIHRDIKPTNVLVTSQDGQPTVKVIDFGIAKAIGQQLTDKTLFTDFAQMIGTPLYMSPEQAKLSSTDIDTRSDIYSLGVLLYELLTGSTPVSKEQLKQAAFDEIRRIIREDEPPKPSTRISSAEAAPSIAAQRHTEPAKLARLVRGELDWIVMKALEKDRSRRYETTSGFARDVERYLVDEPVQACPPSAFYRFRKFARRNQARLLAGGTVAVALLVIATVVAAILGWTARDRQFRQAKLNHEVELAIQEATLARDRALTLTDKPYEWDAALAAAGSSVKSAAGIAAQDEAALSPAVMHDLRSLQVAMQADQQDRQFAARFDAIRLEQSELDPTFSMFKLGDAYPAIRQALAEFYQLRIGATPVAEAKRTIEERPIPIQQHLLAALEVALMYAPPADAAEQAWLKGVLAAIDTAPWRQRARQAVETKDWLALESLVNELKTARQPAADLLRFADLPPIDSSARLTMLRGIRETYPADFWANHQLANCLHHCESRQLDEAIRYYAAALALRPHCAAAAVNLADALRERGNYEAALATYQDALRLSADNAFAHWGIGMTRLTQNRQDEAIAAMREAIRLQPTWAIGYRGLAEILMKQKDFAQAEEMLRKATQLEPQNAWCHLSLGNCLLAQDRPPNAEAEFREAIRLIPTGAYFYDSLGRALEAQQKFDDAEQVYLEAIRLQPGRHEAHWPLAALRQKRGTSEGNVEIVRDSSEQLADNYDVLLQRGILLKVQGKFAEAEISLRKAVRLRPDIPTGHFELARVLMALERPRDAEPVFRETIRLQPSWGWVHESLGGLLLAEGNAVAAETEFREAIRMTPDALSPYPKLGAALRMQKRFEEGVKVVREALQLNPNEAAAHGELGWLYADRQRWPEAETAFREAVRLAPDRPIPQYGLGKALAKRKEFAEAEPHLREAIRLRAGYTAAHESLAWLLIEQQRYAEAEAEFHELVKLIPNRAGPRHGLGKSLLEQGKLPEAEEALREAIRLDPALRVARKLLDRALEAQGKPKEAAPATSAKGPEEVSPQP
jgi:serine/threonine protein kinase/tetratricopeptide (TPR) repeat protein